MTPNGVRAGTCMASEIVFHRLKSTDTNLIELIAHWYYNEWAIPIEETRQRLTNQLKGDVLFQLVLTKDNEPIATGGLYKIEKKVPGT